MKDEEGPGLVDSALSLRYCSLSLHYCIFSFSGLGPDRLRPRGVHKLPAA